MFIIVKKAVKLYGYSTEKNVKRQQGDDLFFYIQCDY
jgi:hypothetical protein